VRGVLALGTALLGYASVGHTLGYSMRRGAVERAHALAPGDGQIAAILSEKLSGPEAGAADRARADRVARTALRREPTAVAAIATLGIDAAIRGDQAAARRLFTYSRRLSRRDLRTNLWSVEDAVARGDVSGALRNYDIALRTSRAALDLMFPVLASAVVESSIRSELTRTIAARPPWGGAFTDFLANNGPDPQASAALFLGLRRAGVSVSEGAAATAVIRLVSAGAFNQAWRYYAAIRPGADRRRSRDPRFASGIVTPAAFDWVPVNDAGVSTSIQRSGDAGVFDFAAPSSVGGPLLSQLQLLPPGDYVLEGRVAGLDQPEGSRPYWSLGCRDGSELGRVTLPNAAGASAAFAGRLRVPPGCPVQTLVLVARPSDAVSGLSGQIERVQLRPAR